MKTGDSGIPCPTSLGISALKFPPPASSHNGGACQDRAQRRQLCPSVALLDLLRNAPRFSRLPPGKGGGCAVEKW